MDSLDLIDPDERIFQPPWGSWGRSFTFGVISGGCKVALNILNTTIVHNLDTLLSNVMYREKNRGLITYCNHTSMMDDPGLMSSMLPWWYFWTDHKHHGMRWSLCAYEVCFKNKFISDFFLSGKTLPIFRGAGADQPVMGLMAGEIARGGWLHIFPEGRIHYTGHLGPFKAGIGKMVCDARRAACGRDPVVLPFFHSGMGDVLPLNAYVPRGGNTVTITIGEAVDLSDLTCDCYKDGVDQKEVFMKITERLHARLQALEEVSPPNTEQLKPEEDVRPPSPVPSRLLTRLKEKFRGSAPKTEPQNKTKEEADTSQS